MEFEVVVCNLRADRPSNAFKVPVVVSGGSRIIVNFDVAYPVDNCYNYINMWPSTDGEWFELAIAPLSEITEYPPKGDWKTIGEMYLIIGLGRPWVVTRLSRADFQPELRRQPHNGRSDWCYPPECFAWLQREAETFMRTYPPMGDFIPELQAIDELGRTRRWIRNSIAKYRLDKPQRRRDSRNVVTVCISPGTLRSLSRHNADYAPAGWYNKRQLRILTGWSHTTICNRLDKAGVKSMVCLAENGRPYRFYAPDALKALGVRPNHYPPAGDNFTERRMASLLGRSQVWVSNRLKMRKLTKTAQMMLDDCNRPREHYTQMVYHTLKRISEKERSASRSQDSRKVG